MPAEPAGPPSPRACSPTRTASGMTAADTQQIAAVLEKAELLSDEVPQQVPHSLQKGHHACLRCFVPFCCRHHLGGPARLQASCPTANYLSLCAVMRVILRNMWLMIYEMMIHYCRWRT